MRQVYKIGWWLVFVPVFFGTWLYCIGQYGFLFGLGLGWLPACICASVAGVLWPVLAVGVAWLALM